MMMIAGVVFFVACHCGIAPAEAFRPSRRRPAARRRQFEPVVRGIRCGATETPGDDAAGGEDAAPPSEEDASRAMYDAQAGSWARTEPRCLSDFTGRPLVFGMLADALRDGGGALVLDVGCGEGYCARRVVGMGAARVVGCDVSEEMIAGARRASEGDGRLSFYAGPVGELLRGLDERASELGIQGGPEGAFDIAMAVFLFNYLTTREMEDAIDQIYRALRPGGTFVFSVPHPSMIFCHDQEASFHLFCEGRGYYSSRNERILGRISTIDGKRLNVMSVHKTLGDYIKAINAAGFRIADIQEAGVTEEHLLLHPDFFESVKDRPLHLIFQLNKPLDDYSA